jgi:hypothetical protein
VDNVERSGEQRQLLSVELLHAPHDLAVDLLRIEWNGELVVQMACPFQRAHAEHHGRRILVPAAAGATRQLLRAVQSCSESRRTPSRSKITASGTG